MILMIVGCSVVVIYKNSVNFTTAKQLRVESSRNTEIFVKQKYILSTTQNIPAKYLIEAKENNVNKLFVVENLQVFVNLEFQNKYNVKIEMRTSLSNTLSRNEIGDINSVKECVIAAKKVE